MAKHSAEVSGDEIEESKSVASISSGSGSERPAKKAKKVEKDKSEKKAKKETEKATETDSADSAEKADPAKKEKTKTPRVVDPEKEYARAKAAKEKTTAAMYDQLEATHEKVHAKGTVGETALAAMIALEKTIAVNRRAVKKRDAARVKRDAAKKEKEKEKEKSS